jgi:hypothetical protein
MRHEDGLTHKGNQMKMKAKTLFDEAKDLASSHRKVDSGTKIVKFFPNAHPARVCLLEVSESVSTTDDVLPFTFCAAPEQGVPHESTVILLSPEEWKKVQTGELALPSGWDLADVEDV